MQTDLRNEQDELEQVRAALTEITADKQRETQERTAERLSAQASLQKQEEDFEQARQVLGEQFAHQLKLSEDATAQQLSRLQVSAPNQVISCMRCVTNAARRHAVRPLSKVGRLAL